VRDDSTPSRPLVVVTGGAGYVGAVLVRELLARGHAVRVLDSLLFGDDALRALAGRPDFELAVGDVRERADLDRALAGAWAVVHLAGIVGDPACALDPEYTRAVNLDSSLPVADACREHDVRRLLFASTCSVYGAAGDDWLDEEAGTAPVSLYAETNLRAEDLLRRRLDGSAVTLTVLRFATIYGVSPRMRFDLVVNLLTARALATGALEVHGGDQWRPQVHVHDVARALCLGLEQPDERAAGVFNIGSNEQNYRIRDLAQTVAGHFPGTRSTVRDVRDPRSYRVCFDRLGGRWGFRPAHTVDQGVDEIAALLRDDAVDPDDSRYHNVLALGGRLRRAAS
jgi:nucleoside-diphosphate-sugar epimerase